MVGTPMIWRARNRQVGLGRASPSIAPLGRCSGRLTTAPKKHPTAGSKIARNHPTNSPVLATRNQPSDKPPPTYPIHRKIFTVDEFVGPEPGTLCDRLCPEAVAALGLCPTRTETLAVKGLHPDFAFARTRHFQNWIPAPPAVVSRARPPHRFCDGYPAVGLSPTA